MAKKNHVYMVTSHIGSTLFIDADIDYCVNATCKNGASCVDGLKNYTCSCAAGFTGDLCETGSYLATPLWASN